MGCTQVCLSSSESSKQQTEPKASIFTNNSFCRRWSYTSNTLAYRRYYLVFEKIPWRSCASCGLQSMIFFFLLQWVNQLVDQGFVRVESLRHQYQFISSSQSIFHSVCLSTFAAQPPNHQFRFSWNKIQRGDFFLQRSKYYYFSVFILVYTDFFNLSLGFCF